MRHMDTALRPMRGGSSRIWREIVATRNASIPSLLTPRNTNSRTSNSNSSTAMPKTTILISINRPGRLSSSRRL
jgi:hypothetical protein